MAGLLPQMSLEPAPGYRRFVECHFEALRRDARRLAGDGLDADELCTDVLADVALRWGWFELLRVRLGRSDPAGAYLGVALARRIARGRPEDRLEVTTGTAREVDVVDAGPEIHVADASREIHVADAGPEVQMVGAPDRSGGWPSVAWFPDRYSVDAFAPVDTPPARSTATRAAVRAGQAATSAAVRIAAVRPLPSYSPSAAVEAVIAWLHAYDTNRRYRRMAAAAVAAIAVAGLVKLRALGL